jgi:transcriptional regulator of arginine metabolism
VKSERQYKIIELIKKYDICTQEDLADALINAGYPVTQATVSRDIRELNLTKTSIDGKKQKYVIFQAPETQMNDKFIRVLKDGFVSMDMAQNILVIKTVSGMAMAVCAALDALNWHEIVGSIAGDDTIMCAVRTVEDTTRIMDKLKNILNQTYSV